MRQKCGMRQLSSPMTGEVRSLDDVSDPIFSSRSMGDGFAIFNPQGHVYSPIDGEILWLIPSKHALGLRDQAGLEYLLHVGIDTVFLEGQGFASHLFLNQRIEKGDLLIELDHDYLSQAKHDLTTMLIITSHPQKRFSVEKAHQKVHQGEKYILSCKGKGCL